MTPCEFCELGKRCTNCIVCNGEIVAMHDCNVNCELFTPTNEYLEMANVGCRKIIDGTVLDAAFRELAKLVRLQTVNRARLSLLPEEVSPQRVR